MTVKCTMILGDCLNVMPALSRLDVDMCFLDLPYGATSNKWDSPLSLKEVGAKLSICMKPKSAILATANARLFASLLMAWSKMFRYDLVWQKSCPQGFLSAKKMPMRAHELIAVFGRSLPVYNPQMTQGIPYGVRRGIGVAPNYGQNLSHRKANPTGINYPRSVVTTKRCPDRGYHPTQKPVALLDWLIKTYSNPGDNVLDPVSGSFTTCLSACLNGRSSVGIEKDIGYFEAGVERVRKTVKDNNLDVKVEVRR